LNANIKGGDFFKNPLGLELDQQRPRPNLPFAKGRLVVKESAADKNDDTMHTNEQT